MSSSFAAVVIGAGISGLATAKCLLDAGVTDLVVLERSGEVGGLWTFRPAEPYGVMSFTHINVSSANYAFSDFPFPDGSPDYPHHSQMSAYIRAYTDHFRLTDRIRFHSEVLLLDRLPDAPRFRLRVRDTRSGRETSLTADHVAVASGHHVAPFRPPFRGLDDPQFQPPVLHSSEYKSATSHGLGGTVLVVGIGNSGVDVAADAAAAPGVDRVLLSTRSGAWVVTNYVFGFPTDWYACRLLLRLPWRVLSFVMEVIMAALLGHPRRWGLNPTMHALQTQPTVSPTLVHLIQRRRVEVVPDVAAFRAPGHVELQGGRREAVDHVVLCTGYNIGFPFLEEELRAQVLGDGNEVRLYKNVFAPHVGPGLAFVGFVQPSSGGLLPVAEMQARWFAELVRGAVKLPPVADMERSIARDNAYVRSRFHKSPRHTIQREPLLYNDEIASFIGARPSPWRHPRLAWRLLLSSCGVAQWRLQGPNAWPGARAAVEKVPVVPFLHYSGLALCALLLAAAALAARLLLALLG